VKPKKIREGYLGLSPLMPAKPGYMSPMSPKMNKLFNADRQNLVLANPEMKFAGKLSKVRT
jgi:hypothetical protein